MDRQQFLLAKLAEEAAEVSHMALKCQQFGLEECLLGGYLHHKGRLYSELDDLHGIVKMLNEEFDLGYTPDKEAMEEKRYKVNKYVKYSQRFGMVDEDE